MCPTFGVMFLWVFLSSHLPEYLFVVGFLCIQVGRTPFGWGAGDVMLALVMQSPAPSASQVMPSDQLLEYVRSGPCNCDCLVLIHFGTSHSVLSSNVANRLFVTFPAKV